MNDKYPLPIEFPVMVCYNTIQITARTNPKGGNAASILILKSWWTSLFPKTSWIAPCYWCAHLGFGAGWSLFF